MKKILGILLVCSLALTGCKGGMKKEAIQQDTPSATQNTFLALGDSYTIGESVAEQLRWPVQLVDSLRSRGLLVKAPRIIARTGWTTRDLLTAVDELDPEEKFDLVSVLIGVNNQYQGRDLEEYEKELREVMAVAIAHSKAGRDGVFALSIPDYGATPFGSEDSERIAREISTFNDVFRRISEAYGIDFYNITPLSKKAAVRPELVAKDGLHPSGKMYGLWVQEIVEAVRQKAIHLKSGRESGIH